MLDPTRYMHLFPRYKDLVRNKLDGWILGSINLAYTATRDKGENATPLAAFILLSCAIDFISGFYAGRTDPKSRNISREYKDFISAYMKNYPADLFYVGVRCDLAHNFVLGKDVVLTHGQPVLHKTMERGREIWNFENVFDDFKIALGNYFNELESSSDLKEKFIKRFKAIGIADTLVVDPTGKSYS